MKKLTLALAALGLTASLGAFAATPTGAQPFQVGVPDVKSGFDFTLTGLFLKPTSSDLVPYMQTITRSNNIYNTTNYYNDPGFNPAFRLGAGYVFENSGNDVRINWTHLNSNDNDSATGKMEGYPIGNGYGNYTANSTLSYKYDAVDLDFGHYMSIGTHLQTRWFAGARFAQINQDQNTTYTGIGVDSEKSATGTNTAKFTGVGPRLGVDANYAIGKGFGMVAQFAAALLVGDSKTSTTQTTTTFSSVNTIDSPSQVRTVPTFDGKLGFDYTNAMRNDSHLTLEAGYQVSEYLNALGATSFDTYGWTPNSATTSVGFHGPYLSLKYKV